MPSIHPIHNMNDSVTSCINVLMMLMLKGISHTLSNCWISAPIMDPSLDIYLQHELNFRVFTLYGI